VDLHRVGNGWETEVHAFAARSQTASGPRDLELVLRLYPGVGEAGKAAHEFWTLRLLHGLGYPVPEVHWLECDPSALGRPFLVMERIAGRSVHEITSEEPDEARRRQLEQMTIALLVQLHALDWRLFLPPGPAAAGLEPAALLREQMAQFRSHVRGLGSADFEPVFDWLEVRVPTLRATSLSWIHCDFHPGNVLLGPGDRPVVIDWGASRVMDPRYDLALSVVLTSTWGNPGARERLLAGYERIAGRPVEQIEWFEAAACAMRLAHLEASLRAGAGRVGLRPGAEAAVRRAGPHLRNVHALLRERIGRPVASVEDLLRRLD
jgi:aminoglycoside phosphotransferase (APT) family kinase protein